MRNTPVYIAADNILSPLGTTTAGNFSQLSAGVSGVREHNEPGMAALPFYAALLGSRESFIKEEGYTRFEQLLIASIQPAVADSGIDPRDAKTVLIISTTKGNISLLETAAGKFDPGLKERIALHTSARLVAEYFGFNQPPIVASNACISGVMAILTGMRLIRSGRFEHAVIAGADLISNFVLSGFQSFQAISARPCRPFDRSRDGITLGEGAGTIILSSHRRYAGSIQVLGGSTSNDANHLSAPSRTGEELCHSIVQSLRRANLSAGDIDFISAHGTATLYNDEMEAKALTLANLQSVPVNSLKGYYGHTLGAAGLIESIIAARSLKENLILPSLGFEELGVSQPLNICSTLLSVPLKSCLKTASGFGGSNAALVLSKE